MTDELRRLWLHGPNRIQQAPGSKRRLRTLLGPDNHHGWAQLLDAVIVSFMGP
jgi:hypothetical protein